VIIELTDSITFDDYRFTQGMVQVWGCDDMLSLRNFLCNFVIFWSSQGNLSSKKTEENDKEKNVS